MRPIDAIELQRRMCALCNQDYSDEPCEPSDCVFIRAINEMPTLTQPNEPLTWEELKAETKINPVYSMKYGWIFPTTVRDEQPYAQIWFFTSKGFAQTELFYHDTFYRRPLEGKEGTK